MPDSLSHANCAYCLKKAPGKCDSNCHPDRDCMALAILIIYAYIHDARRSQPPPA
jgi:hypothetical protein